MAEEKVQLEQFYLPTDLSLDKANYTHRDSYFYPVDFENTASNAKRPIKAEILVDRCHPYIFTQPNSTGTGRILQGLIDRETGLFLLNNSKKGVATQYLHNQALEAMLKDFKKEFNSWGQDYRETRKPMSQCQREINRQRRRWSDITSKINAQIAQLPTNVAMDYNSHLVYQDEAIHLDPNNLGKNLVTERMSIENPKNYQDINTDEAEKFLNVFLDAANAEIFSWYMGAILMNKDIDDETISRALVVLSPGGGRGKTTLVDAMLNNLLPKDFVDRHGLLDTIFDQNNKFGTSAIKNRRVVVYNEAYWGTPRKDGVNNHDFNGLNIGALKTVWGDGVVDAEAKFQDLEHRDAKGLHIVCSNFAPIVTNETNIKIEGHEPVGALARRILPCLLRPTSMSEKGKKLRMTRDELNRFVKENALQFAVLFTRTYLNDPRKFVNYSYDPSFLKDVEEAQQLHIEQHQDYEATFSQTVKQSFIEAVMSIDKAFDSTRLIDDIVTLNRNIRIVEGKLYINASSVYLSRFGELDFRDYMKLNFPRPIKHAGMNMFVVTLNDRDCALLEKRKQELIERNHLEDKLDEANNKTPYVIKLREKKPYVKPLTIHDTDPFNGDAEDHNPSGRTIFLPDELTLLDE